MSIEDKRWQRQRSSAPTQDMARSSSPGKRTLSQSLPPRPASVGASIQRKRDAPAADVDVTAQWIDTAMRPDLHPPPVQRKAAGVDMALAGLHGDAGTSLPHQDTIQASFGGHDVSSIRVHDNQQAATGAAAIQARAYASGENVAMFGSDLHDAAHEAAHVVQQRGASVGTGVVESAGHEAHADAVADAVVAGESAQPLLDEVARPGGKAQAGGIARIKDTKNGGANVDIGAFTEQQCYLYLQSDPAMAAGTVWQGWEWEDGDKAAIESRFNTLAGGQLGVFKANLTNGTLDPTATHRNIDPGTLATFDALVDALKNDVRVTGFDSWFYGSIAFNVSDPDKLLDAINELRAAQARLGSLAPGETLDLSEQPTGTVKASGEQYTADGTIDGGANPNQYEVKTVREPCYDISGIKHQITEGLNKFTGSAGAGKYEVDIYAAYAAVERTIPMPGTAVRKETPVPADGKMEHEISVNGTAKPKRDYVFRVELLKWLNRDWKRGHAGKINVRMENGLSFSFTKAPGGAWV